MDQNNTSYPPAGQAVQNYNGQGPVYPPSGQAVQNYNGQGPVYPLSGQAVQNYNGQGPVYPPHAAPQQYQNYGMQQGPPPMFPGPTQNSAAPQSLDGIWDVLLAGNKFVVAEKVRMAEVLSNFEFNNNYEVIAENGFKLMHIKEKSKTFQRWCCGNSRAYLFLFQTADKSKVLMEMTRDCHLNCCGFIPNNCSHVKIVEDGQSREICSIRQGKCWCSAKFKIEDHSPSLPEMKIDAGCIVCSIQLLSKTFIFKLDGAEIKIKKVLKSFRDAIKEAFSDATRFEIVIPPEIKSKSYIKELLPVLIASVIQIDMGYFEASQGDNQGIVGNMM